MAEVTWEVPKADEEVEKAAEGELEEDTLDEGEGGGGGGLAWEVRVVGWLF